MDWMICLMDYRPFGPLYIYLVGRIFTVSSITITFWNSFLLCVVLRYALLLRPLTLFCLLFLLPFRPSGGWFCSHALCLHAKQPAMPSTNGTISFLCCSSNFSCVRVSVMSYECNACKTVCIVLTLILMSSIWLWHLPLLALVSNTQATRGFVFSELYEIPVFYQNQIKGPGFSFF